MNVIGYILICLSLVPLLIGMVLLIAIPLGALAGGIVAAPFAIQHALKTKRKRVLIVEGDRGAKVLLKQIVRSADPRAIITESNSKEEATRMIYERAKLRDGFDFVIADIRSAHHWPDIVEPPQILQKPLDLVASSYALRNAIVNA